MRSVLAAFLAVLATSPTVVIARRHVSGGQGSATTAPNLVLLVVDDLGSGDMAYNSKDMLRSSPHLLKVPTHVAHHHGACLRLPPPPLPPPTHPPITASAPRSPGNRPLRLLPPLPLPRTFPSHRTYLSACTKTCKLAPTSSPTLPFLDPSSAAVFGRCDPHRLLRLARVYPFARHDAHGAAQPEDRSARLCHSWHRAARPSNR